MNSDNYYKAKKLIEEHSYLIEDAEGASQIVIDKAQSVLNLSFPRDYKCFLEDYGALTFGSSEIYGVFREDFENSGIPDAVWLTLNERQSVEMPEYLLPIYDSGMGDFLCLNFKFMNKDNNPKVVSYFPSEGNSDFEILYDSFSDFLIDIVQQEINNFIQNGEVNEI